MLPGLLFKYRHLWYPHKHQNLSSKLTKIISPTAKHRTKNNCKAGKDVNTNAFYLPKLNSEKTVNNSKPQSASRAVSHRTSTFSGAKLQNLLLCLYYNLCNFADVDSFHMLICGFLQFLVNCSIFSKFLKYKRKEKNLSVQSSVTLTQWHLL